MSTKQIRSEQVSVVNEIDASNVCIMIRKHLRNYVKFPVVRVYQRRTKAAIKLEFLKRWPRPGQHCLLFVHALSVAVVATRGARAMAVYARLKENVFDSLRDVRLFQLIFL